MKNFFHELYTLKGCVFFKKNTEKCHSIARCHICAKTHWKSQNILKYLIILICSLHKKPLVGLLLHPWFDQYVNPYGSLVSPLPRPATPGAGCGPRASRRAGRGPGPIPAFPAPAAVRGVSLLHSALTASHYSYRTYLGLTACHLYVAQMTLREWTS